jgi:hypothetical protein
MAAAHPFIHLDDYVTAIQTEVAQPIMTNVCDDAPMQLPFPVMRERWPPADIPFKFWGSTSVFASHCEWLLHHLPMAYVQNYWTLCGRLPGLAHLHFVYNNGGCGQVPTDMSLALVDAPADLCICDCVLPANDIPPPLTERRGTAVPPPLQLIQCCLSAAFQWTFLGATEISVRLVSVPEDAITTAMVHVYCSDACPLPENVRARLTIDVQAHAIEIARPLLDHFGVNHDLDANSCFDVMLLDL